MRVRIATDIVLETVGDWVNRPLIDSASFATTSARLLLDLEGIPGSWKFIFQSMHHSVAELLGQEFATTQLSAKDVLHQELLLSTDQLSRTIQNYCERNKGWVNLPAEDAQAVAIACHDSGLKFADSLSREPNLVLQQSPNDLKSLLSLVAKSKELATPMSGMKVGMQAASPTG